MYQFILQEPVPQPHQGIALMTRQPAEGRIGEHHNKKTVEIAQYRCSVELVVVTTFPHAVTPPWRLNIPEDNGGRSDKQLLLVTAKRRDYESDGKARSRG